jgi:hypothetical protein
MGKRVETTSLVTRMKQLDLEATRGPWFVRYADDTHSMSAAYVAACDGGRGWAPSTEIIAITWLQEPDYATSREDKANTRFIVEARTAVPRLCDELESAWTRIDRLTAALEVIAANDGASAKELARSALEAVAT